MRLEPSQTAPAFEVDVIGGPRMRLEDFNGRRLWLVLSRYAACPFCSLRVDKLIRWYPEIEKAGVELLIVFPSPMERIQRYVMRYNPPFRVAADPDEHLYRAYATETSWKAEFLAALNVPKAAKALVHAPNNLFAVDGPLHRVPAEFLIDRDGRVARAFYGEQFDDGLPFEEVLDWARTNRSE